MTDAMRQFNELIEHFDFMTCAKWDSLSVKSIVKICKEMGWTILASQIEAAHSAILTPS